MAYQDQAASAPESVVVEMVGQTVHMHNGNLYRLWPGMKVELPAELAAQWCAVGLAKGGQKAARTSAAAAPAAPQGPVKLGDHRAMQEASDAHRAGSALVQEVTRTDLRIAANHGDVAAVRKLDAMGDGHHYEYPYSLQAEGVSPQPLTLTDEGAPGSVPADAPDAAEGKEPEEPKPSTGASARRSLGGGGKG